MSGPALGGRAGAGSYALTHGIRRTRSTLRAWRAQPGTVARGWASRSLLVAVLLLGATWIVSLLSSAPPGTQLLPGPPLVTGGGRDLARILSHNLLVLALHSMACVAGFIAGSSLPLQAERMTGINRWVHERGRPLALGFVVAATLFSLGMQAVSLGRSVAVVAAAVHAPAALVIVTLLPHALLELTALFLPLAAWVLASRREQWDQLLAATIVTTAAALPALLAAALLEVYLTPHLAGALLGVA